MVFTPWPRRFSEATRRRVRQDRFATLARAEAAQRQADAAAALIVDASCAAGSRNHFVQQMRQ
jgi:hypothetical protein